MQQNILDICELSVPVDEPDLLSVLHDLALDAHDPLGLVERTERERSLRIRFSLV